MPELPDLDHWLPQVPPMPRRPLPPHALRHATEADFADLDARLRLWCDERTRRGAAGRLWFRHFGGTSWLAETTADRRPLGLLTGCRSADRPGEAIVELVAVDPEHRRRGIGRALVESFLAQLGAAGATAATATCRPDDRAALAFLGALGFEPVTAPGGARIYGVPAFVDWDGAGEDRVLLQRRIGG